MKLAVDTVETATVEVAGEAVVAPMTTETGVLEVVVDIIYY